MAITEADKARIFAALDAAHLATIEADGATPQRAILQAVATAAGHVPPSEVAVVLREHAQRMRLAIVKTERVVQPMDAIMNEVQCANVATPADLLAKRNLADLPACSGHWGSPAILQGWPTRSRRRSRRRRPNNSRHQRAVNQYASNGGPGTTTGPPFVRRANVCYDRARGGRLARVSVGDVGGAATR